MVASLANSSVADCKAVARYLIEDMWNAGNIAIADQFIASDFVDHTPLMGQEPGRAGLLRAVQQIRSAFPDLHFVIEDVVTDGDTIAYRWTGTATHKGEFMGMGATGKQVTLQGIDYLRVQNGKLQEHWNAWDRSDMPRQLGMMPQS